MSCTGLRDCCPPCCRTSTYHAHCCAAGSRHRWDDYEPGERIDHVSGITLEDSDHMFSTRLYQNTARVHFDAYAGKSTRFGRRLAYGGHVISLARALSFNGLANQALPEKFPMQGVWMIVMLVIFGILFVELEIVLRDI